MKSKLLLFVLVLGLVQAVACTTSHRIAPEDADLYRETYYELGYPNSRKLSEDEKVTLDKRMQLKKIEQDLKPAEREQFYLFKTDLTTDDDKINFLSLPTMAARDRYADQKGFYYKTNTYPPPMKEAIQRKDIIVGMPKDAVIESWGDPLDVEVAGNEAYGNERWKYVEYVPTIDGYQKQERLVIFENGKVAGWRATSDDQTPRQPAKAH